MPESRTERFEPRAGRAMAAMFDGVSGRYDLLNSLMTLGRDRAWRRALARAVPERAATVVDLCTGNGVSLAGLRRPGRLVIGVDVSLGMLAAAGVERAGWWPRLLCADAFRLPFPAGAADAVTVAFGLRNLRPRSEALAEIRRVLRPGGTLAVLEATAPRPGPLAALHLWHLRHGVPLLGRLSGDPSAYRYLGASILEFGDGSGLELDLAALGFRVTLRRRFLAGAAALWVAEAAGGRGEKPSDDIPFVQSAREGGGPPGAGAAPDRALEEEARIWNAVQAVVSAALTAALGWGIAVFAKSSVALFLEPWQRALGWILLIGAFLFAGLRTLGVLARRGEGRDRR